MKIEIVNPSATISSLVATLTATPYLRKKIVDSQRMDEKLEKIRMRVRSSTRVSRPYGYLFDDLDVLDVGH